MGAIDDLIMNRPWPATLFHYTSQAGLLGILRSRAVWATDVRYLNDSREHQVINAVTGAALAERLAGAMPDAERYLLEHHLARIAENAPQLTVAVFSLSEMGDQLSQWRGYCPDGNGFALGFEPAALMTVARPQGFSLLPCLYRPQDHRAVVDELIDGALERLRNPVVPPGEHAVNATREAGRAFYESFTRVAPALKDESFSEEREWRLVSGPLGDFNGHPRFGVRPSSSGLRPYIEIAIGRTDPDGDPIFLGQCVVGPTPHPELTREVLRNLFLKHSVGWNGIQLSAIPYRTW